MKKVALVIGIASIAVIFGLLQLAWLRIGRVRVESNGSQLESARVYRNLSGDLLIDLRQAPSDIYVVRGSEIGQPNISSLLELPPVVLARHSKLPIVNMRSEKAGSVDPRLSVGRQRLSFVTETGKSIEVTWR